MAKYISQRAIQRQKKRFWKSVILFVVLAGVLLFLVTWLSNLDKLNIQNIKITGNSVLRSEEISKIVNENILGKYLWLFSKSNFLIYPKVKIKKDLVDSFAQIKDSKIKFEDFQSIVIEITERTPSALWCNDILGQYCYFMDEEAYLYDMAPNFSGDVYFKYVGGFPGVSTSTPTTQVLRLVYLGEENNDQFNKLNLFIRLLRDININGYQLITKDNGDYELFFNNDSRLIFDVHQDFDEIFVNLRATLIELGDLEEKEFNYIDLRFDNKVVYKFRD